MINIIIFIELGEWDVLTGGLGRTMRGGGGGGGMLSKTWGNCCWIRTVEILYLFI